MDVRIQELIDFTKTKFGLITITYNDIAFIETLISSMRRFIHFAWNGFLIM